jgi:hypothetical protein
MKHISELLPAVVQPETIAPLTPIQQRLLTAAAAIQQQPPNRNDLAFMAKELVQCTLPHSDPGDPPRWTRVNGNLTLVLMCSVGYPYGSIPRLILFWLTREAKRNLAKWPDDLACARRIMLGRSFYAFLKELGFDPDRGGRCSDSRRVKEQIRRLFSACISFSTGDASTTERRLNMLVAEASELWWSPKRPEQSDLWASWVELGEKFFLAITASPVPLDYRALKALKRSPLALDLYAWAAHKVYTVKQKQQPQFVPWKGLHQQFGSDYGFRKRLPEKSGCSHQKDRGALSGDEIRVHTLWDSHFPG